jgi:hypothetical protein
MFGEAYDLILGYEMVEKFLVMYDLSLIFMKEYHVLNKLFYERAVY